MYKKNYKEHLKERKTSRQSPNEDGGEFAYLGETLHVTNILNPRDHRNIKWPLRQIIKNYVPEGHTFKAFPIQFTHFDTERMIYHIM